MGLILPFVLLVIALIVVAIVGSDGLWHNIITFFNVLVAALLATNYYPWAAEWLDYSGPTFTYLIDPLVLWGLFALLMVIFRALTNKVSRVRVRFKRPVDVFGGYIVSVWTAWVLICFTMMTLHTAALSRNFLGGTFQATPETRMFAGTAPDRQWLALMHRLSGPSGPFRQGEGTESQFDPQADFILRYAWRRFEFETKDGVRVNREWGQSAR